MIFSCFLLYWSFLGLSFSLKHRLISTFGYFKGMISITAMHQFLPGSQHPAPSTTRTKRNQWPRLFLSHSVVAAMVAAGRMGRKKHRKKHKEETETETEAEWRLRHDLKLTKLTLFIFGDTARVDVFVGIYINSSVGGAHARKYKKTPSSLHVPQ